MAPLMVLVSFDEGAGILSPLLPAENIWASCLADRPPGRDWTFSFWASMMSKSIRSFEAAIFAETVEKAPVESVGRSKES